MPVFNAMETIVVNMFDEFQKNYELKCDCNKCKDDMLALALNKIPPRYTSSEKGALFVKGIYINPQLQSDVMRELMEAANIVADHQHHEA
ncbi:MULTISPECIES: late competence development ComFB family protein [Paenibacillus]|uniref:Late competence development ComFB family protein n=2 Tax=Paenibacillus TaxID=44249 RepID=A0ABU3RE88_9BACL|nr:late competence development ComFB family protein [Paenibacillus anseongense]MDU0202359.1 late competence development ComFB family protein [Paenibacillus sp. PFR10]MEC0266199.1 late competence development ComFB family protein [Paenibacillus anseongense]